MASRVDIRSTPLRQDAAGTPVAPVTRFVARQSFLERCRIALGTRLMPLACRVRNPALVAAVVAMHARPWSHGGRRRVLVISKDIMEEDVRALGKFGQQIAFSTIGAGVLKRLLNAVTDGKLGAVLPRDYFTSTELEQEKLQYRSFLMRMLPWLLRFLRLDAVMAANWTYVSHIELARTLRDLGVPFVVLYKEGQIVPGRVDQQRDAVKSVFYDGPVYVRAILTYNEMVAQRIDGMGMHGIERADIRPVGPPRMDFYRRHTNAAKRQDRLTFFLFSPFSAFYYFRELQDPDTGLALSKRIEQRTLDVYRTVLEFARHNPDLEIVLKGKRGSEGLGYAIRALSNLGNGQFDDIFARQVDLMPKNCARLHRSFVLPGAENVRIDDTANARDLICQSQAIMALNSITMIEATMAATRILIPDFSDLFPGAAWNYFHFYPQLASTFVSAADIETALTRPPMSEDAFLRDRDAFLEEYLVNGMSQLSTYRLEREMLHYIGEREPVGG